MVEIIPKPEKTVSIWENILPLFAFVLIFGTIAGYFIVNNLHRKSSVELENLEAVLSQAETGERKREELQLKERQNKISDFAKLVAAHSITSNFFDILEKDTHPNVWFSEFKFDLGKKSVKISGESDSFKSLGQQLLLFQSENQFKEINLSEISKGEEGETLFTFMLSPDSQIFIFK